MDTSDGLADALFQIAKASKVKLVVDEIEGIFGAEDYKLVAVLPEKFANKLKNISVIGKVQKFDGTYLEVGNKKFTKHDELGLFNHFG